MNCSTLCLYSYTKINVIMFHVISKICCIVEGKNITKATMKRWIHVKILILCFRAAFQYGVKMADGRKTRRAGPKDEKAELDRQWQKIQNILKTKSGEPGGKKMKHWLDSTQRWLGNTQRWLDSTQQWLDSTQRWLDRFWKDEALICQWSYNMKID